LEDELMSESTPRTGYAPVNGLNMYYQIHGDGFPLVLIHGGFGLLDMFNELIPRLAASRQVIAVDLQSHGRTADIDRPFSYAALASDVAALIRHLGFEQADVLGFSLGGMVAQHVAIHHPETVRKLIAISSPYKTTGWYPEVRAGMASISVEVMSGSMMHDVYLGVAPDPAGWTALVNKTCALMSGPECDWSAGLATVQAPTLLVFGDGDSIPTEHMVEMFGLLGGGKGDPGWESAPAANQLAILPGTTHYNILDRVDLVLAALLPFLDAPVAADAAVERG
jgi:pimeloyl-ACP methyl ester carboxylesterase